MKHSGHYNVAPRYSAGSPALVDERTALGVARDERRAFAATLEGIYGADAVAEAKQRGLRGIVELRREVAGAWLVDDILTGERFIRPVTEHGEKVAVTQRRELRLKEKHHLLLERELPPVSGGDGDYAVENHGSLFLVRPLNDAARAHLADNVGDEAQWFAGALAVEHRYIEPLVEQLRDFGWEVRS